MAVNLNAGWTDLYIRSTAHLASRSIRVSLHTRGNEILKTTLMMGRIIVKARSPFGCHEQKVLWETYYRNGFYKGTGYLNTKVSG